MDQNLLMETFRCCRNLGATDGASSHNDSTSIRGTSSVVTTGVLPARVLQCHFLEQHRCHYHRNACTSQTGSGSVIQLNEGRITLAGGLKT
jgi:hypothetical protein